jgi:hypothetical protein
VISDLRDRWLCRGGRCTAPFGEGSFSRFKDCGAEQFALDARFIALCRSN